MAALKLIAKEHLIDNIWLFRFKPSEPLDYTAGQFVRVELPHDNPDSEGAKRWFTNSAAPYESILQITTRITNSSFKQALAKFEVGNEQLQLIEDPAGDFVWQETDRPIIFIAGGIGITPFYSILKQRVHDHLPIANVSLIYGARTEDVPFKEELAQWSTPGSGLSVQYVINERIAADKLTEIKPDLNQSLVYLSGPEPMVEALGDELKAYGLPEDQLKQDFFPNYNEQNY